MTRSLTLPTRLPAMTPAAIDKVRALQITEAARPQVPLETRHVLHGGMYARTILLPNGVELVAALIKIPTLVIVEGSVMVWLGSMSRWLTGQTVLPASAGRKQVFYALLDSTITMIFPTAAKTVADAEACFTDEASLLASRRADAVSETIITGE